MSPEAMVVDRIVERYHRDAASLIMVLQDVQAELNYLPPAAIDQVARRLDVPRSQVYSVASFYKGLSLEPQGRHKVDVCMGTACHVRGAGVLLNQLSGHFGIEPGNTTEDREVTLKSVHCVGACALGPVVVIDGEYHGEMNPTRLTRAVKKCCSADTACSCPEETAPVVAEPLDLSRFTDHATLEAHREKLVREKPLETPTILVCAGTGCIANTVLKWPRPWSGSWPNRVPRRPSSWRSRRPAATASARRARCWSSTRRAPATPGSRSGTWPRSWRRR